MRDSLKLSWLHSRQRAACRSLGPWPGRLSPRTGSEVNTNDSTPYTSPPPPTHTHKSNEWGTHWSYRGFIVGRELHADLLGLDLAGFLHALAQKSIQMTAPSTPPPPPRKETPQKNSEWGTHWSNLGFIVGSDLHADLLGLDLAGFLHALAPLAVDGGEPGAQNSTPQRPLVVLASQLKGKALQHTRNLVNTAQQFSVCLQCLQVEQRLNERTEDVPVVEFTYLVFTGTPGDSYRRWPRLYLCYAIWTLITFLVGWSKTEWPQLIITLQLKYYNNDKYFKCFCTMQALSI